MWLWIILGIIALLLVFFVVMGVLGRRLPEDHVATLTLRLNQPVQGVWDVIADAAGHKHWVKGVTSIERLPDRDNHEVWRQRMGRNSFILETTTSHPPTHMVRTIADDNAMF